MYNPRFLVSAAFAFLLSIAPGVFCGKGRAAAVSEPAKRVPLLIAGGGASGVAAGIQAARLGVPVLIIEESPWLGGMLTAAGVSAVDGNKRMPAGIFGEFRSRLARWYGGLDSLKTGWVSDVMFEPSVGDRIFKDMAAAEKNLEIVYGASVSAVMRLESGWRVTVSDLSTGKCSIYDASVLVDATELGDVARAAGAGYDTGMESRFITGEDIAPDKAHPTILQDLTYVAILKDYGRDVSMASPPPGYDPARYSTCCINSLLDSALVEKGRLWSPEKLVTYGKLPNNKYMVNWPIMGNDYYLNLLDMTPVERDSALVAAKNHTLGFVYFIQHHLGYTSLGLADDEYPTSDRLPFIPYHRESRRIHGLVRMNLNHITDPYNTEHPLYRTGIAVGDYPVDHHHKAYAGSDSLPNLYFYPVPSFNVPLGVMIPDSVPDLIVTEKSISVSNIANGATRLQPVVLQLGQAAGALAALSVKEGVSLAEVSVRSVQDIILGGGGYLMPYLDAAPEDPRFAAYQRIGASGILRGEGRSVNWSNETWLHADSLMSRADMVPLIGFLESTGCVKGVDTEALREFVAVSPYASVSFADLQRYMPEAMSRVHKSIKEANASALTKGEYALIIDSAIDPFHSVDVDMQGNYKIKYFKN